MKPLVSVLMATFNNAPFLSLAVDSILNQTFTDFEFMIINDASTDETSAILDSYHDPRIIRLENPVNLNLPASLNRGLAIAQGKYIARMDSDDISYQERLAKQLQFMEAHPEIGVLGTAYGVINEKSEYVTTWTLPQMHNELMLTLLFTSPVFHGSAFMRADKLRQVHGYNAAYSKKQDIDLWTRLCKITRFHCLPEALYQYRIRPDYQDRGVEKWTVSDNIRRHFIEELIDAPVTENEYANFRLGQTADPVKKLTTDETFTAINLLFRAFNSLEGKGYFEENGTEAQREVLNCMVRILGHCAELKQFIPELFRFFSSGSVSKYYWFNNDFPKVKRWLGYGFSSPGEFLSELFQRARKKDE
jgi:glycosyltransferase involved in cell wall biosynthesis